MIKLHLHIMMYRWETHIHDPPQPLTFYIVSLSYLVLLFSFLFFRVTLLLSPTPLFLYSYPFFFFHYICYSLSLFSLMLFLVSLLLFFLYIHFFFSLSSPLLFLPAFLSSFILNSVILSPFHSLHFQTCSHTGLLHIGSLLLSADFCSGNCDLNMCVFVDIYRPFLSVCGFV